MVVFWNIILLIVGLALLIKGADFFVDGASKIAKLLKVPSLIIGLTIVALGTSLPELAVSVVAAINTAANISNSVDLSVGNVVGSNICNTLLVLGATCLVTPVFIEKKTLTFEIPFALVITVFLMIIGLTGSHTITWYYGLIFLFALVFYIIFLIMRTKKEVKDGLVTEDDETVTRDSKTIWMSILYLVGGGCAIAGGGELVNSSAQVIAAAFGMEQKLIALTIVAIGTSLPELVTSLMAIKKGENDIALGNVLGSNILNILFILGIAAVITPLPIASEMNFDLIFLTFITVLLCVLGIIVYKQNKGLSRVSGIILLSLYALYMIYIIGRNYNFFPSLF